MGSDGANQTAMRSAADGCSQRRIESGWGRWSGGGSAVGRSQFAHEFVFLPLPGVDDALFVRLKRVAQTTQQQRRRVGRSSEGRRRSASVRRRRRRRRRGGSVISHFERIGVRGGRDQMPQRVHLSFDAPAHLAQIRPPAVQTTTGKRTNMGKEQEKQRREQSETCTHTTHPHPHTHAATAERSHVECVPNRLSLPR